MGFYLSESLHFLEKLQTPGKTSIERIDKVDLDLDYS